MATAALSLPGGCHAFGRPSVQTVAHKLGYNTTSAFIAMFQAASGTAPNAIRARLREEDEVLRQPENLPFRPGYRKTGASLADCLSQEASHRFAEGSAHHVFRFHHLALVIDGARMREGEEAKFTVIGAHA